MHIKSRKTVDKLFLTILILAIPLYQKFPLLAVTGTFTKIRLEDFLMAALFVYTAYQFLPRLSVFLRGGIERAHLIFFGVGLLSLASAYFVTRTLTLVLPYFIGGGALSI